MDLTTPARSVIPTLDAEVLMALAAISMPLTGRQISRLLESKSASGVQKVLERLNQQGLVDAVPAGNANLYSLNRDHVAAPAVEALRDLRGKLFERMAKAVQEWRILPEAVAVFGSAVRGDGRVESDIDILIVRPAELHYNRIINMHQDEAEPLEGFSNVWRSQLFEFNRQVYRWSGNQASLIEVTQLQLEQMVDRGEPVAESLRKEARYIWGQNIMKKVDSKG